MSIIAGTTPAMSWWQITISSILGSLPRHFADLRAYAAQLIDNRLGCQCRRF